MEAYLTPDYPILRPNREGYGWYLDEPVTVDVGGPTSFTIPKGYKFDGHSVPRVLWALSPPFGRDIYAALVHDYMYEYAKTLGVDRSFADDAYDKIMCHPKYRMNGFRATVMPFVVKVLGWSFFYLGRK